MTLFFLYFYSRNKQKFFSWKFDFKLAKSLLSDSWPLLLSAIAMSIYLRIDQIMIGQMMSMTDVGLYAVAVKFSEFGNFIPGVLITSLLPAIILSKKVGTELFVSRFKKLYGVLFIASVGIAVVLTIFSEPIVNLLYGSSYAPASLILRIYVWSIIPMFISVALAQYLVIEKLTIFSLYTTLVGAVSNIILNLILIPQYGLVGAAISTVISYSIAVLSILIFKETRTHGVLILSSFNLPKLIRSLLK